MFTINGVTQDKVSKLEAFAKSVGAGFTIKSLTVAEMEIVGHGVDAIIKYDAATSYFTVNITKKPWYISESAIERMVKDQLESL